MRSHGLVESPRRTFDDATLTERKADVPRIPQPSLSYKGLVSSDLIRTIQCEKLSQKCQVYGIELQQVICIC